MSDFQQTRSNFGANANEGPAYLAPESRYGGRHPSPLPSSVTNDRVSSEHAASGSHNATHSNPNPQHIPAVMLNTVSRTQSNALSLSLEAMVTRWPASNSIREASRLKTLCDAVRLQDYFYLTIHHIYCLQAGPAHTIPSGCSDINDNVWKAFGEIIGPNETMNPIFLAQCSKLPSIYDIRDHQLIYQISLPIRDLPNALAEAGPWSFQAGGPPMVYQLKHYFRISSPLLQIAVSDHLCKKVFGNDISRIHIVQDILKHEQQASKDLFARTRFHADRALLLRRAILVSADHHQLQTGERFSMQPALLPYLLKLEVPNVLDMSRDLFESFTPDKRFKRVPKSQKPPSAIKPPPDMPSHGQHTVTHEDSKATTLPSSAGSNTPISYTNVVDSIDRTMRRDSYGRKELPSALRVLSLAADAARPMPQRDIHQLAPGRTPNSSFATNEPQLTTSKSRKRRREDPEPKQPRDRSVPAIVHPEGIAIRSRPQSPSLAPDAPAAGRIETPNPHLILPALGGSQEARQSHPTHQALHQAHQSPLLRTIQAHRQGGADLYRSVSGFILGPRSLDMRSTIIQAMFVHLPVLEAEKRPALDGQISETAGSPIRYVVAEGNFMYRLRCAIVPLDATNLSEAWTTAEMHWPERISLKLNGHQLKIRRQQIYGREMPIEVTYLLQSGLNRLDVTLNYGPLRRPSRLAFAIERIVLSTRDAIFKNLTRLPVMDIIEEFSSDSSPSAFQHPRSNSDRPNAETKTIRISLTDPTTSMPLLTPVRSKLCNHRDCFDLDIFLSRLPRADHNQIPSVDGWVCPICGVDASPQNLVLDGLLVSACEMRRDRNMRNIVAMLVGKMSDGHSIGEVQGLGMVQWRHLSAPVARSRSV